MAYSTDLVGVEPKQRKFDGTADLETAISLTGHGRYHAFLIFVGGFCFLAVGFEYGLNAYVIPSSQCDLQMTSSQMGVLNALFLGGGIASSFVWGVMADISGRKKTLVLALTADGIVTIIASLAPSYVLFAVLRSINGFLCGAPGSLVNSYCAEFFSDKHRSRSICIIGFFWTVSWMLAPALAWVIIPITWQLNLSFVTFNSWRLFTALIGIPNIAAGLILAYCLPETPKFLYATGKENESIEVLKQMFAKNTGNSEENYPVKRLVKNYAQIEEENPDGTEENCAKDRTLSNLCSLMGQQTKQIFKPPYLQRTLLCSAIYFTNMFGYYGIGLWLPELFNRFEKFYETHPNQTVTVCELSRLRFDEENVTSVIMNSNFTDVLDIDCSDKTVNMTVFANTLVIGAVCCVGNIVAAVLSNKVGGRILSIVTMLTSGVCGMSIYFLQSSLENLIVSCIFMTAIGTALVTITSCVVNLYPTTIRGMGVCIGIFVGRIGAVASNLVFGMLLDISCEIPILLLGGTVIFGGILSIFLPKNSQKAAE